MITNRRPAAEESNLYFKTYIDKVNDEDIFQILSDQKQTTIDFLESIPVEKHDYAYVSGKWTLKEVLLHIMDTERVFAYRALRIGRNDKTPLPGFEQDDYIAYTNSIKRSMRSIIDEYKSIRDCTLTLLSSYDDTNLDRIGKASGHAVSVRALFFIVAGHEVHHIDVIKERYL
ncbi:MAG: DinB family protein [Chitinophagales bacterium]|nr:DinB family protein [Chitinophagales bacterium]